MFERFHALPTITRTISIAVISALMSASCVLAQKATSSDRETDLKVEALLKRMSVEEKIGQLNQSFHFVRNEKMDQRVVNGEIGSFVWEIDPVEIDRLQHLAVEKSRLHIPLVFMMDVIHGYGVTFPVPIANAASWDLPMIQEEQRMAAKVARHAGLQWAAAPMVDIARDPRWGRIIEGAGEDPYLGAEIAVAQVHGFQGAGPIDSDHMVVSLKHFAGYGYAEGGRDHDEALIPETVLRNVVLKPFKAAIDAGAGSVMSAYMDLNDVPATGNHWLLSDLLRSEWKFKGVVISDNNAVTDLVPHGFAKDPEDGGKRALDAGVDMQMSNFGDVKGLLAAAKDKTINVQELDRSVRRMLKLKYQLGLFDHPYIDEAAAVNFDRKPLLKEAQVTAERSTVLLKNSGGLLPLRANAYRKVALIGPLADSKQNTLGPWLAQENVDEVVTVRRALEESKRFESVTFAQGVQLRRLNASPFDLFLKEKPQAPWTPEEADAQLAHAVEVARDSDLVIAVMGEMGNMSGESASRASLDLPGRQEELLKNIASLGKPVVLVLMAGRPLTITWEAEHIPAILDAWYPGTEGGHAVVNLLFGDANPGGKLPMTWPRDANQIPLYLGHTLTQDPQNQGKRYWDAPSTPLFPFGYGLSYSKFDFATPHASASSVRIGQPITIEAQVTNTSEVAGDVVAQLYIHQRYGTSSRPVRELRGFDRVPLQPHETKTVRFNLNAEDLTYWCEARKAWVQDAADFDFWVGEDSTASATGKFAVTP
jgi:beta-glucosidase